MNIFIQGLKFTQKGIAYMGGEGSGHHGHSGRPGSVGGSAPSSGDIEPTLSEDQAIAQWKQGKEYTRYYQMKDLGRENEFVFSGNDVIQERKRAFADKTYEDLNNFIDRAPPFENPVYKFVSQDKLSIEKGFVEFNTKESWTGDIEGMSTFASEGGYLLVIEKPSVNIGKFVDISKFGLGNYEVEHEVISQKGMKAFISKQEPFEFPYWKGVYHLTKLTLSEGKR